MSRGIRTPTSQIAISFRAFWILRPRRVQSRDVAGTLWLGWRVTGGFTLPSQRHFSRLDLAAMGHITTAAGALIASLALAAGTGALGDWPQWRGPQRDGHTQNFKPPAEWPAELAEVWQLDVGLGHSSPVVAGKSAYVFTRCDDDEVLAKIDLAQGGEQWHYGYPAPYQVNPAAVTHGKGPKSTPVVADGRVFTFGIAGVLTAWDAKTGKQLWQREFSKLYEKTSPLYGVAMSPAVDGERCIVHVGGHDKGALVALDVQSGETLWTADEDGPAYASPIVITLDEVRQVVTQSQRLPGRRRRDRQNPLADSFHHRV